MGILGDSIDRRSKKRVFSINDQIDSLGGFGDYSKSFLDSQTKAIENMYDELERASKDEIQSTMKTRSEEMRKSLEQWKSYSDEIRDNLTTTEKLATDLFYWNRRRDLRNLEREARYRFDDIAEDAEDMSESIGGMFSGISDTLREWGNALNLNSIANGLSDTTTSMREIRTELQKYLNMSDDQWKNLRDYANQFSQETDYAISNMEYLDNYKTIVVDMHIDDEQLAKEYAKVTSKFEDMTGVATSNLESIFGISKYLDDPNYLRTITSQMMQIQQTSGLRTNASDLVGSYNSNAEMFKSISNGNKDLLNTYLQQSMALTTAQNAGEFSGVVDKLYEIMSTETLDLIQDQGMTMLGGVQIQQLMRQGKFEEAAELLMSNVQKFSSYDRNVLSKLGIDSNSDWWSSIVSQGDKSEFISAYSEAMDIMDQQTSTAEKFIDQYEPEATKLEKLSNKFKTSKLGSLIDDISNELDITLAEGMLIVSGAIDISQLLFKGAKRIKGLGKLFKGGSATSAAEGSSAAGGASWLSKAAPYAAGAAPGLALAGYGTYGVVQGIDAAKSTGEEWQKGNYGRSAAYGADTGVLIGAGATTAVAGGIGIAAGVSAAAGGATAGAAALAGLAAVPVVGWIAAGLLAVGLGTKAILDNTEKVNGFSAALEGSGDTMKDQMYDYVNQNKDQLLSIKKVVAEEGNELKARQLLMDTGISEETLRLAEANGGLTDFIDGLQKAYDKFLEIANKEIDNEIDVAVKDLNTQMDDDKRSDFISASVDKFFADGSSIDTKDANMVRGFLMDLAKGMDGQARTDFEKAVNTAIQSHGGLSESEFKALLGDKSFGSGWRAMWSTDIDLKKAYLDNASDMTVYNDVVDKYLQDDSLKLDTTKVDNFKDSADVRAHLSAYYSEWKSESDEALKSAMKDKYAAEMENFKTRDSYESLKDQYVEWAHEMGISGYLSGLSYVPFDNYPSLLHKGETVLTADEAVAYRNANNAGWTPNESVELLNKLVSITQMGYSDSEEDSTNDDIVDTIKWAVKEITTAIEEAASEGNNISDVTAAFSRALRSSRSSGLFNFL